MKEYVPIEHKFMLTIKEAAAYTNIGENKLASLARTPNCPFAVFVGTKKLIIREALEDYLRTALVV